MLFCMLFSEQPRHTETGIVLKLKLLLATISPGQDQTPPLIQSLLDPPRTKRFQK